MSLFSLISLGRQDRMLVAPTIKKGTKMHIQEFLELVEDNMFDEHYWKIELYEYQESIIRSKLLVKKAFSAATGYKWPQLIDMVWRYLPSENKKTQDFAYKYYDLQECIGARCQKCEKLRDAGKRLVKKYFHYIKFSDNLLRHLDVSNNRDTPRA